MEYISNIERIGMQKEAANLITRLISKRFAINPDKAYLIFTGLAIEQLEELAEMLVDA